MDSTFTSVVDWLMKPSATVLFAGFLVIMLVPLLLHMVLVSRTQTNLPTVLLAGPSQSGKTSLSKLFEYGHVPNMFFISQVIQSAELTASKDSNFKDSFNQNRDDATGTHTKFLLVDTPGHGKLRGQALGQLASANTGSGAGGKLKAVIYMVDAAILGEQSSLAEAAGYLYDILLAMQKKSIRQAKAAGGKGKGAGVPVLIAANKLDLFTALPGTVVKTNLETEMTRIRESRSKGLLDSGVGVDEVGSEDKDDWLGAYGSKKFTFAQMSEFDIEVDVIGGNVMGKEGPGVEKWWQWIAYRI